MSAQRSTTITLAAGLVLAGLCFASLQKSPLAYAQTKTTIPTFTPRTISMTEADDLADLVKVDKATADLVQFVEPGVVHIISESGQHRDVMGNPLPAMGGEGSGVVYRPDGYIVTNDHVVGGFDKVTVVLADGHQLPGKVIRAQDMDIAVVKVDAKDLPTLPFADSKSVRPGQFSMAVGSPFGLDNTVTFGHISAIGRTDQIRDDRLNLDRMYGDLIQTDTPINMGNSGGPLVNVRGEVVGINTAIFSQTGTYNGVGFAIPSNTVKLVADKLIQNGKVERGALGLVPQTLEPYKAKELGVEGGAIVTTVANGTPAAMAGIKEGDIIVRVGNIAIADESDVRDAMLNYSPGDKVEVEVIRDKQHKTFDVTLTSPDKLPKEKGVAPETSPQDNSPFPNIQIPGFGNLFGNGNDGGSGNGSGPDSSVFPRTGDVKLGVSVQDLTPALRTQFNIPSDVKGAVVISVADGSPAAKIGLQPGDVIEELGGKPVESGQALKDAMADHKWGEQCSIKFGRYGEGTSTVQTVPFKF